MRVAKLLRLFCPPHLLEEIEGDLMQRYEKDVKKYGANRADRRMLWNTVRYARPGILLRNKFIVAINPKDMLVNYLKVMYRHLAKHKLQSAINLLGLTVGIAFAFFTGIYIQGELTVNTDMRDAERIYLMESKSQTILKNAEFFVPSLLAPEAKEKYPQQVDDFYRFFDREITVSKDDKHFRIQSMVGDSTFLQIFGFKVLYGNPQTALTQPNSAVITEKTANQFFDRTDVIGETLTIHTERSGLKEFIITAVMATPKAKNTVSDLANMNAQIFLPLENITDFSIPLLNGWFTSIITYIKLTPSCDSLQATQMLNQLLKSDAPKSVSESMTIGINSLNNYYLIANHGGVQKLLTSLSAIVGLILLLAIANFVNLSIANSFSRLKEIGMRRVIGGVRRQIGIQFLAESLSIALFSGALALLIYEIGHGYGGDILNVNMPSVIDIPLSLWGWFAIGIFAVGLLAGSYPALHLSSMKVIESLKGKLNATGNNLSPARFVISFQYVITFFVIISATIITLQVNYFMDKDMGYDKSQVITVSSTPRLWNEEGFMKMETAKSEFMNVPGIEWVTLSWGTPNWNFSPYDVTIALKNKPEEKINAIAGSADEFYPYVFGLEMNAGKFFTRPGESYSPGTNEVVLNRTAQEASGYDLGDIISFTGRQFTIVGIVEDFNFESMQEPIKPIVIMNNKDFGAFRHFSFKLKSGSPAQSLKLVETAWKKVFPSEPFVYTFAEDSLKKAYKSELQLQKASTLATVLTSMIVATGILGLVSLNLSRRGKEIGIRRVLGATFTDIHLLVAREYIWIIIVSISISWPLTYWYGSEWLSEFAYRIKLSPTVFLLPTLLLVALTVGIVVIKSYQSASIAPAKTLRSE